MYFICGLRAYKCSCDRRYRHTRQQQNARRISKVPARAPPPKVHHTVKVAVLCVCLAKMRNLKMLSQVPPNAGISPALHSTRTPQLRQLRVQKPFLATSRRSRPVYATTRIPHVQQQESSTSALQPADHQLQRTQRLHKAAAAYVIAEVQRRMHKIGLWCKEHRLQELLVGSDVSSAMVTMLLPVLPGGGFSDLFTNRVFLAGFWGWFTAQTLKIFTKRIKKGVWDIRAIVDSGGMPSSHSALCAGITTAIAYQHGMGSSAFALAVAFSSVVMYDAAGVRRHAGKQAEVLNQVIGELLDGHPVSETKLKEVLGHTPLQVCCGAIVGALFGIFYPIPEVATAAVAATQLLATA